MSVCVSERAVVRACVRRGELSDGSDESTEKNTRARQTSTGVKRTLHLTGPSRRSTEWEEQQEEEEEGCKYDGMEMLQTLVIWRIVLVLFFLCFFLLIVRKVTSYSENSGAFLFVKNRLKPPALVVLFGGKELCWSGAAFGVIECLQSVPVRRGEARQGKAE